MVQFSLYFDSGLINYFNELLIQLKKILSTKKNCISISIGKTKCVLMLAMYRKEFIKCENLLKESIANFILYYYKPRVIIQAIKGLNLDEHLNVILLHILVNFDSKIDKEEIKRELILSDKLYLSSFVNFKLRKLLVRWSDVGHLMNENSLFLSDYKVKIELMRFLLNQINSQVEYVKIIKSDDQVILRDLKKNSYKKIAVFYSKSDYDNDLFTIINKFPKTIEVANYKQFNVNFIDELYMLFGDRLKLL